MIPSFNGEWTFIVVSNVKRFMIEPEYLNIIPNWIRRSIHTLDPVLIDEPANTSPIITDIQSCV